MNHCGHWRDCRVPGRCSRFRPDRPLQLGVIVFLIRPAFQGQERLRRVRLDLQVSDRVPMIVRLHIAGIAVDRFPQGNQRLFLERQFPAFLRRQKTKFRRRHPSLEPRISTAPRESPNHDRPGKVCRSPFPGPRLSFTAAPRMTGINSSPRRLGVNLFGFRRVRQVIGLPCGLLSIALLSRLRPSDGSFRHFRPD